jgi:AraC-like DNA-binding protein
MAFAGGALAHFHVIERGGAWLSSTALRKPLALAPGDVVVIAPGVNYQLSDQPARKAVALLQVPAPDPDGRCRLLRNGGGGVTSVLVCGSFALAQGSERPLPLFRLLPRVLHLPASNASAGPWLEPLLKLLMQEAMGANPGSATIVSRLTDVLFVQVLRAWLDQQGLAPSWLTALGDTRIGPALALMHENPAAGWTSARLARQVGLTRSAFSTRFARVVGEPPQAYLTQLRMQRAGSLIHDHSLSIGAVAQAVGYESESSFNKAFRREYATTPGRYRKAQRASAAGSAG